MMEKGVALATPKLDDASLDKIFPVDDWGRMGTHHKIPSVISYSPPSSAGELQWGASLSEDAITMVNMKMELDVQGSKLDELELLLQVLDGTSNLDFDRGVKAAKGNPEYTWKNPEDIITDYLTRVFHHLNQVVAHFGPDLRAKLPVDIVITIPVVLPSILLL